MGRINKNQLSLVSWCLGICVQGVKFSQDNFCKVLLC